MERNKVVFSQTRTTTMTTDVDSNASTSPDQQQHGADTFHPWSFYFYALHWLDIVLAPTFIILLFSTDGHNQLPRATLAITVSLLILWFARGILAQTRTHFGICLSLATNQLFGVLYVGLAIILYVNRPPLWPVWLAILASILEFHRYRSVHPIWILMQKETMVQNDVLLNTPEEGV